jgi:hypothetical protein
MKTKDVKENAKNLLDIMENTNVEEATNVNWIVL